MENRNLNMFQLSVESLLKRVNDETEIHNTNRFSSSIHMAPSALRDLSPSSFDPHLVSIGPLHKEHKNVQAFEQRKGSFVNKLLSRAGGSKGEILETCMRNVYASMKQIKAFYVSPKNYGEPKIAEMMVIDACFILEFIFWYSKYDVSYSNTRLLSPTIIYDLVLLENQIPFFILDQIYQCTILKNHHVSLVEFIHPVLKDLNLFKTDLKHHHTPNNTIPHILSLLHECYKPPRHIKSVEHFDSTMCSVAHLDKAGLKFKPNKDPKWEMQMKVKLNSLPCCFGSWSKPTLKLPVLYVHDFTEVIIRNLIAYEQSCQTCTYITSYAYAIDMLVNTQEDVAKLVDSQVLVNDMGSNEEAANMINSLCKNVICQDFFYSHECEKMNAYCNAYWPKNIVKLKRAYFNSPWNIIALFAAITLFALTMVQTIFTIKSAK